MAEPVQRKSTASKPSLDPSRALQLAHGRLKARLGELEKEYKVLSRQLAQKKKLQQARSKAGSDPAANLRLQRLSLRLERYGDAAQRQARYLQKLRLVQQRNERLLSAIASRLAQMETALAEGRAPAPDVRAELLTMLGELQQMRQRREQLSARLQPASAE